ncbi:MAG: GMP synthase [Sulfolobaceae archaeon]|nr:GMP synthase [Sulfolobaceae archaeon]
MDVDKFIDSALKSIRNTVKDAKTIAAISGGVDSTTATVLAYRALGDQLLPVIIDTGFMRKEEVKKVKQSLASVLPTLKIIDRSEEFISALEGVSDAEEKRKRFRETFYMTLSTLAQEFGAKYLIQGTIAPDWIETSGGIKTQHNVLVQIGIDPLKSYGLNIIEPLADLYKDEVREVAKRLGIPDSIVFRQPFPGPGLAIRVVGRISREKLEIVREATDIVEERISGYSQYFPVIFENVKVKDEELSRIVGLDVYSYNIRATGVKGDNREYGRVVAINGKGLSYQELRKLVNKIVAYDVTHVLLTIKEDKSKTGKYSIALRAVSTQDFMTADIVEFPLEFLEKLADEILKLDYVNEFLYDITSKPPATIEFE